MSRCGGGGGRYSEIQAKSLPLLEHNIHVPRYRTFLPPRGLEIVQQPVLRSIGCEAA